MSRLNRKFSLDSCLKTALLVRTPPNHLESEHRDSYVADGGRLSKVKKGKCRSLFDPQKTQSLEDAQLDIPEFNKNLKEQGQARSLTMDFERSIDRPEGSITRNSFIKHNKTFHKLFREIPESEDLTHAFTCALQREVLYHGKLYVSPNHICFHSSVLLKETKVVIPVSTVRLVKKQNTALLVPNALAIYSTAGEKYLFLSLRSREACYKLLCRVCPLVENSSLSKLEESSQSHGRDLGLQLGSSPPKLRKDDICEGNSTVEGEEVTNTEESVENSWVWTLTESVTRLLIPREFNKLNVFLCIYLILALLLLLSSGYIGMRIVALEEQLTSMGAQPEFTQQNGYKDT